MDYGLNNLWPVEIYVACAMLEGEKMFNITEETSDSDKVASIMSSINEKGNHVKEIQRRSADGLWTE